MRNDFGFTSFLYFKQPNANDTGVSKTTLDDSRITELISENVQGVLKHPCDVRHISERQKIFKELEKKGDFYSDIISLRTALVNLDSSEGSRRLSTSEMQKYFKTVKLLEAFLLCCDKIISLKSESELINNAVRYWRDDCRDYLETMRADVAKARELISCVGLINFRLDRNGYSMSVEQNNDNYVDKIDAIAKNWDITLNKNKQISLTIDNAISNALEVFFPELYRFLKDLFNKYSSLPISGLYALKKEIDFYFEITDLCTRAEKYGIPHAYPETSQKRRFIAKSAYDISLMHKRTEKIVPNDINFEDERSFCFLTGANGGGKTTYLRTVAINLILSLCGAPAFCESAVIYPYDKVFTHFPSDERFSDTGRLLEEEERINAMLDNSSSNTFLLFNETFSGTDDVKGCKLTLSAVERIKSIDASGLFVTHFHEVSLSGIPMLCARVDENNNNKRTFKIDLKRDGINSSYANDILKKYNLDRDSINRRIAEMKGENVRGN